MGNIIPAAHITGVRVVRPREVVIEKDGRDRVITAQKSGSGVVITEKSYDYAVMVFVTRDELLKILKVCEGDEPDGR